MFVMINRVKYIDLKIRKKKFIQIPLLDINIDLKTLIIIN